MKTKFDIDQLVFVKFTTGDWRAQKIIRIEIKRDRDEKLEEEYFCNRKDQSSVSFYSNSMVATIQEVNQRLSDDKKDFLDKARKSMKELERSKANEDY